MSCSKMLCCQDVAFIHLLSVPCATAVKRHARCPGSTVSIDDKSSLKVEFGP